MPMRRHDVQVHASGTSLSYTTIRYDDECHPSGPTTGPSGRITEKGSARASPGTRMVDWWTPGSMMGLSPKPVYAVKAALSRPIRDTARRQPRAPAPPGEARPRSGREAAANCLLSTELRRRVPSEGARRLVGLRHRVEGDDVVCGSVSVSLYACRGSARPPLQVWAVAPSPIVSYH